MTDPIRTALERLIELHYADAAWGLHWDNAIADARAALAEQPTPGEQAGLELGAKARWLLGGLPRRLHPLAPRPRPAHPHHGGPAMTQPLSPAAQAVSAAYGNETGRIYAIMGSERRGLAAALRELADQVAPPPDEFDPIPDGADRQESIRDEILSIAAELEAEP